MKRVLLVLSALALYLTGCGCNTVEGGHIGRQRDSTGFEDAILTPGIYMCGPTCRTYAMEVGDHDYEVKVSVLCADSLPFNFDVNVLAAVDLDNKPLVKSAFENLKPTEGNVITSKQMFDVYISSVVQESARKAVARYATSEIVGIQGRVMDEIHDAVTAATKGSLMKVKRITISDLSFPDIITKAQEQKAQRHVEIETARAEGDKAAAQAEAQLKIAAIQAQRKLLEAQAVADANRIIADSITPGFIAYEQILAMQTASQGDNNVFFFPYQDASNKVIDLNRIAQTSVMNAELMGRLQSAKDAAHKAGVPLPSKPPAPASK